MIKRNLFQLFTGRSFSASLYLLLAMAFALSISEAQATQSIMTDNGAPSCVTCHTGGAYSKAEGKAGLAAFLATKPPVCIAPQVLNAAKTACITPTPTTPVCKAPLVLNAAKTACVSPTPTTPVCKAPLVLNAAKTACVSPTPTTPVCKAPLVLNAAKTACVSPTPTPSTCGSSEHDDDDEHDNDDDDSNMAPVLTVAHKVSVHAGARLTLVATAYDCADRSIEIQANNLPNGATIVNSFDTQLNMPKAVISWTPSVNTNARSVKIVLKAIASDTDGNKIASEPKSVTIKVLPAVQEQSDEQDNIVKSSAVASARINAKSKKLEVSGQVLWDKTSTTQERRALIAKDKVVITDANTGAQLGTAAVGKNSKWKKVIPMSQVSSVCAIDASFHGKTSAKIVKGAKNCQH